MKAGDTVYVTKYALSQGIFEAKVESIDGKYVMVYRADGMNGTQMVDHREVEVSKAAAEAKFAEMVRNRIASLEASIVKLKKTQPKFKRW